MHVGEYMGWNRKVDRIFKLRKELKDKDITEASSEDIYVDEYYNPDEDREPINAGDNLEKGDLFAMILSAWITIIPISLGILLLIVGLAWLLLGL